MRSPIIIMGGKGMLKSKILPYLDVPCKTYVEPFGGGASVLLARDPAPIEVYNDIDSDIVNFFKMLRDDFAEFQRLVSLTPVSREEYYFCRDTWKDCEGPERYRRWFVVARNSFGGIFGSSWGSSVTLSSRGMASTTSKWLSIIELLPEISDRLLRVQIENQDWRTILKRFDRKETLFYLDPPYVHSTRNSGEYNFEMSDADHVELIERIKELKGMVLLSGYNNEIYDLDWEKHEINTISFAAAKTGRNQGAGSGKKHLGRTECLWENEALRRARCK